MLGAGDLKAESFASPHRSRLLIFSKAIRSHHLGSVPFSFSFNLFSSPHADPPRAPPFRCSQAAGGDFLACTKALGPYEVLTFLQPFTPLQTIPHQGGWWGSVSSAGRGGEGSVGAPRNQTPGAASLGKYMDSCSGSEFTRIHVTEFTLGWTLGMSQGVKMQP